MSSKPRLQCHPLTSDRWADFETLFGERGACGGCWCTFWRRPRAEFVRDKGAGNRRFMLNLVDEGEPPGILGYMGEEPVGWCAVAPRQEYLTLEKSRILKPVDDTPVWSISCLFVEKKHRRKGFSVQLLRGAMEHVRLRGGKIVEGYPIEPKTDDMPAPFAWVGLAAAFLSAGFREVARRSDTRPIMRYQIEKRRRQSKS